MPASTPTDCEAADAAQALVDYEQVRAHYAQIPAMALAPTLGGVFSSWVLWDAVDNRHLLIGMAAVIGLSALRLVMWRHYFKLAPAQAALRRWRVVAVLVAGISGCIWGSAAPFLYPPQRPEFAVFLVVLLTLLPVVPIAALAVYLPTLYAYYLPCLVPFVTVLALRFSRSEQMAALLLLMMMGAMLTFARRYSKSLAEAIRLRVTLDERSRALQDALRAKSQFILSASHDLRQPVHPMGLFLRAMREPDAVAYDAQAIAHLDASLNNLRSMLTNMLDISRLDAEVIGPQPQHFAIDALLQRLADEHAPMAAQKGLEWRWRCPPAFAFSDPLLLERILRNLLSNALKYAGRGGVLIACRGHGAMLRLQVFDTGIGIAAADQGLVFDEFTRLANRERNDADGLGVGLAIVQRMARLLGHPLALRSVPGRGTVFTITVPRGCANAVAPTPHPAVTAVPALLPGWVLVIDDDVSVGAGVSALLQRWGHRTSVCTAASEALRLLSASATAPQLLIADLRLAGGRSGLDAVADIRKHLGWPVPVILVTGDTAPIHLRQAYEAGYVLLHKPVDPAFLRLSIAEVCRPQA